MRTDTVETFPAQLAAKVPAAGGGATADRLRGDALGLAEEDAAAFTAVTEAYRLPKGTGDEAAARSEAIATALVAAANVPSIVVALAEQVLGLQLLPVDNREVISDVAAAIVDVGTNPTPDGGLVGDVDADSVTGRVAGLTPVPGGSPGHHRAAPAAHGRVRARLTRPSIAGPGGAVVSPPPAAGQVRGDRPRWVGAQHRRVLRRHPCPTRSP